MLFKCSQAEPDNTRFMNDIKKTPKNEQEWNEEHREVGSVKEVEAGRPSLGRQASGSEKEIGGM